VINARGIKELITHYNLGISPRRLGQHFLIDSKALQRIADVLQAGPDDRVLEIGAGLGALTEPLLATGAVVYAVERDSRFLRVLTDRFKASDNLQLVRSDILNVDLSSYAGGEPGSLLVAGNIPYSLTGPILEYLVAQRRWIRRAVLTVQKEVAQRITAKPDCKEYSPVTLLVSVAFKPSIAFHMAPGSFYPQPNVISALLRLDPLPAPAIPPEEEASVRRLIRLIFTHRRKTILNALLTGGFEFEKAALLERLQKAGINPVRRPETFSLTELIALTRVLQ